MYRDFLDFYSESFTIMKRIIAVKKIRKVLNFSSEVDILKNDIGSDYHVKKVQRGKL